MKNIFLLAINILLLIPIGYAQVDTINFEMNTSRVEIDTTNKNNIWQIGKPSKTIFDSASSLPNAIVTDTINYYPVNNHSSFQIGFVLYGSHPAIGFKHKFDTDKYSDGGYVEVSFDTGTTWILLSDTTNERWRWQYPSRVSVPYGMFTTNFYSASDDILYNGKPGFNGSQSQWIYSTIEFPCMAVKKSFSCYVRFTFISDSIQTNKEGWMIDDIFIGYSGICSGIAESKEEEALISIAPNPFSFTTTLTIDYNYLEIAKLTIVDMLGRQVMQIDNINNNTINLEKGALTQGMYFYQLTDKDKLIGRGKLMIE